MFLELVSKPGGKLFLCGRLSTVHGARPVLLPPPLLLLRASASALKLPRVLFKKSSELRCEPRGVCGAAPGVFPDSSPSTAARSPGSRLRPPAYRPPCLAAVTDASLQPRGNEHRRSPPNTRRLRADRLPVKHR
ncbi:unnamed protein product [Pleuronectes platessa]|uniref:Uncharacterized protein n=1 Tax=Pleuronectes platessa TaxID=8262 RepID=A0A9N7UVB9_PLEPL|nr:unnamed protein product [Pleuronectes platessa]